MMDRRSQHDFPAKRIDITGFLNHCWTEGWFDEYSNDHFLIKAIEDRVSDLECKTQMISNNSLSIFSPINENGAVDFSQFSQYLRMLEYDEYVFQRGKNFRFYTKPAFCRKDAL